MKLQAVILTGSRQVHNSLLAGTSVQSKVLLPVGGKPMVLSVLEALQGSKYQPNLYISSNDPDVLGLKTDIVFSSLPSEANAVQSMLKSMERILAKEPDTDWILFVSGDHPLLTPEMVNYFVDEAMARELVFSAAVVSSHVVKKQHPQSQRTYFPARAGGYSGGNMFLMKPREFESQDNFLETVDRNRKQPWKSLFLLDPLSIVQGLFRRLDIHEIADRVSRVYGCKMGMVEMPFAEACMDVDKPSDKILAEQILSARQAVPAPQAGKPSAGSADSPIHLKASG